MNASFCEPCSLLSFDDLIIIQFDLKRKYQGAGTSWKDAKYKQLGTIITDCSTALSKPVSELQDCVNKLESLKKAIEDYERTNIK